VRSAQSLNGFAVCFNSAILLHAQDAIDESLAAIAAELSASLKQLPADAVSHPLVDHGTRVNRPSPASCCSAHSSTNADASPALDDRAAARCVWAAAFEDGLLRVLMCR
jgi:hypothetical protein